MKNSLTLFFSSLLLAEKYLQDFILERCGGELEKILKAPNAELYYGLPINVLELLDWNEEAGEDCLAAPIPFSCALSRAIQSASSALLSTLAPLLPKPHISPRFFCLPCTPWTLFERLPDVKSIHRLVSLRGTVVRVGAVRMQELRREFECQKCLQRVHVEADDWNGGGIGKPVICVGEVDGVACRGTKFADVTKDHVHVDYQEIKVQECIGVLAVGSVPRSLPCILKHELVDACRAGEEVLITGVLGVRGGRRSGGAALKEGARMDGELFLMTSSVLPFTASALNDASSQLSPATLFPTGMSKAERLKMRDRVVESFCPGIHGMFLVKLAVLLTVIGGAAAAENGERREGHILLVGDPGTGKSQFLLNATKLLPRSLIVSGSGTTAAGLTATAVKDATNHWSLEAGALVLADRGICAIDEFGGMRKGDRAAVHEAMEQQTVSIAKAGMVCKLNTRCSVVAACNPQSSFDDSIEGVTANVAIASPLLSRFDLIFMLSDHGRGEAWDARLAEEILGEEGEGVEVAETEEEAIDLAAFVAAIRDENPKLSEAATLILSRYYQALRSCDPSSSTRTTPRLLGSLARLCTAHAKLMGRAEAHVQDACIAVMLMERSLGVRPLLGEALGEGLFGEALEAREYDEFEQKLMRKLEIRLEALDSESVEDEEADESNENNASNEISMDSIDEMEFSQFTCATHQ